METITSRKNEKILHLKKLGSDRKYRYECRESICDGEKLLWEAVENGVKIKTVLTESELKRDIPGAKIYLASRDIIDAVSPLKTVQSVLFSYEIEYGEKKLTSNSIIIENVQDPGNVGTVIRTANAMGIKNVMLLGACADIHNPKTSRASMGAVFRENIFEIDYDDVNELRNNGIKLYGAALSDRSISIDDADMSDCVFVIGNEGKGLTERLMSLCSECVIIPMAEGCESLNAAAAAAIIMWEMRKGLENKNGR